MSTGQGASNPRIINSVSSSLDANGNYTYFPQTRLYNLTPTAALTSSVFDTYNQTYVSFHARWSGSDGNPANATASFQVSDAWDAGPSASLFGYKRPMDREAQMFEDWQTVTVSSSAGSTQGIPINGKQGSFIVRFPDMLERYVRVVIRGTGAGSSSLDIDVKVKDRG